MRSRYQSKDKKQIQVHVKFEGGLSIQFGRKKRCKKTEHFLRGSPVLFSKVGV